MARTINVPTQQRAANTYGPFEVNGRQIGDEGCRIQINRGNDGAWPLTADDTVLRVLVEGLYSGQWLTLAAARFTGGTQKNQFDDDDRLVDWLNVRWPKVNDGTGTNTLVPDPPDEIRATFDVEVAAPIGLSVQWL